MGDGIKELHAITSNTKIRVKNLQSDIHLDKVEEWLSAPDTSTNVNEAQKKRQAGTGDWLLHSRPFQEWQTGTCQNLWLHGIPGCGKTVLSAMIIDYIKSRLDSSVVVLEFFFDFTDTKKQTLDKLLRSLIAQLYSRCADSRKELDMLFADCENGRRQPPFESLSTTFINMLEWVQKIKIIIDALDECKERTDVLPWIENLARASRTKVRLFITSRREADIEAALHRWLPRKSMVSINPDSVNCDIRAYVHDRLRKDPAFGRWYSKPNVQDEIEIELMQKANGM